MNLEEMKRRRTTVSEIIQFYKDQLKRFEWVGMGNKTEFGTVVTDVLIDCTKRRLKQLNDRKFNLLRNGMRTNG